MGTLFDAVIDRQLLAIKPNDKSNLDEYLNYAFDINASRNIIVIPSNWLEGTKYKAQLDVLLESFKLIALIDLSAIWSPVSSISFSLLVLDSTKTSHVVMASYEGNPVERKVYGDINHTAGNIPNFKYKRQFVYFLSEVEKALEENVNVKSTLFKVPYSDIDFSRLQVSFYHPDNQIDFKRYKAANFKSLDKVCSIINVRKVKSSEEVNVFSWRLLKDIEANNLPIQKSQATNYKLIDGDVVITPNLTSNFVVTKAMEGVYAPANSFVLSKLNQVISAEYISLYFKSDFAKKYSLKVATGAIIKRLRLTDLNNLPILIPSKSAIDKSMQLYAQLADEVPAIDKINHLLASKQDNKKLEDSFLLEGLEKLRISKRVMIERLIKEDLKELRVCIDKNLFKATMVISGSILEAVILDWLSETEKHDYYRDETEISLNKALSLLSNLGEIDSNVLDSAHNIRKMRNLIHPRNYLQNQRKVTRKACKYLLAELNTVINAYKN
jgi:hypothetical protein